MNIIIGRSHFLLPQYFRQKSHQRYFARSGHHPASSIRPPPVEPKIIQVGFPLTPVTDADLPPRKGPIFLQANPPKSDVSTGNIGRGRLYTLIFSAPEVPDRNKGELRRRKSILEVIWVVMIILAWKIDNKAWKREFSHLSDAGCSCLQIRRPGGRIMDQWFPWQAGNWSSLSARNTACHILKVESWRRKTDPPCCHKRKRPDRAVQHCMPA